MNSLLYRELHYTLKTPIFNNLKIIPKKTTFFDLFSFFINLDRIMIKKFLGIFIALFLVVCSVFSPQYITAIIALPFIYLVLKIFTYKKFIDNYIFFISLITFFLVFTLNYIIINHTNIVIRHDVQQLLITSDNACLQKNEEILILISCDEKPFLNLKELTYLPVQKGHSYKIISVENDSENFIHSVILKMEDNKKNIIYSQIKNNKIGEFKINNKTVSITNNFLIYLSYIATIPIFLSFIVIFSYFFFF